MTDTIRVNQEERKRFTSGRKVDRPKYTFFALNNAVRYAGANKKSKIGNLQDIYDKFEEEHPEGDFEDWKEFYLDRHDGDERLEEATEDAYDMFLQIREAIQQIDRENMREFVKGIVLHGTYEDRNAKEAVIEKLKRSLSDCLEPDEDSESIDLVYRGINLKVMPENRHDVEVDENIQVVYYQDQGDSIDIDISSLNKNISDF